MKCEFEYDGDCFNCDSPQYMGKCKPDTCGSAVPMTNADRIRAMSDEEFAEFLYKFFWGRTQTVPNRTRKLLDWLRQPAEEGD